MNRGAVTSKSYLDVNLAAAAGRGPRSISLKCLMVMQAQDKARRLPAANGFLEGKAKG